MEARHLTRGKVKGWGRPLAWLLALILSLQLSPQAYAHTLSLSLQSSVLSASLVVDEQTATPKFPDRIDFKLKARGFQADRATLNYRLVGDPVTSGVQRKIDGSSATIEINLSLDLSIHYIPPGAEVAYYWTLQNTSGASEDTPAQTFKVLDERYNWRHLTNPEKRISVHWYEGSADFGKNLLDTASGALDRLQRDIGAGLQRPADIWVYATARDLRSALPYHTPEWVGGKAFPDLALVSAAIDDDETADLEIKRTIPHELSHLVLYQATRNPYNSPPAWLDEGIAVYNQETRYPDEEIALKEAAGKGRIVPLRALSGSFGADPETALLSYTQAGSVVEFILKDTRYGPEKLARTVAAFREGVTYDEALQAGLGITVDELDEQWRASLPYEIAPQPLSSERTTQTGTTRTSPDAQISSRLFIWVVACAMFGLMIAAIIAILTAALLRRRPV